MDASIFDGEARTWHVYWQAAVGRNLLSTPMLARRVRSRLLEAHRAPQRRLIFFLLTGSEIHLLSALPASDKPDAIAHGVANVVARWVRDVDGIRGPVLAGSYRARPIDSVEQLLNEVRMLAWRPVYLGLCVVPTQYVHSAIRSALGLDWMDGFNPTALHRLLGKTLLEGRSALRSLVAVRTSVVENLRWELERGISLAAGAVGPSGPMSRQVRGAAAALVAASGTKDIAGALKLLQRWVEVKLRAHAGPSLVDSRGHWAARERALVANLAVQSGLCSAGAVARHYEKAKATLSEQMAASRTRALDRKILAIPLERIAQEALALIIDEEKDGASHVNEGRARPHGQ